MTNMTPMMKTLVRLGAAVRLHQLDQERAAIVKLLPGVAAPKRHVSTAARKAMSAGMKRFWAQRRKEAK